MQQQQHGRIFRTGLSVENGEAVYQDGAIKSRVFHEASLSLVLSQNLKMLQAPEKSSRPCMGPPSGLHIVRTTRNFALPLTIRA
jgi:hypothetical protein